MRSLRQFAGATVLFLSTVGFVACLAGIVGIWIFRQNASEKVRTISPRLEVGLARASAACQTVHHALEKARGDVAKVSKESTNTGGGDLKSRLKADAVRKVIQQQVGPNINELGGRLATLSDAAVAASSLLQSFQELPAGMTSRIKPERLERLTEQAPKLSASLRRLQAVVGEGNQQVTEKETVAAASDMELVLEKCQATVDDWQSDLSAAHEELPDVQSKVLRWLTLAAITVTVVCGWVAVSQISLFVHARQWWRDTGVNDR
jgi:hypothetical protein